MQPQDNLHDIDVHNVEDHSVNAAPTAASITIFAVVVAVLFGGMYFFLSDNVQQSASTKSPSVAESPATTPAPPTTTGQGGNSQ